MVNLDPRHPVAEAFLAISTHSKPVSDDQCVDEIKRVNPSLHYITRDFLNNLLGVQRTYQKVDSVNGFIRKSYEVRDDNGAKTVRCEYVVYGGVGKDGARERDDKFFEIMNTEPPWRGARYFMPPKPGVQSRSRLLIKPRW
jgi:hypothetical protein